MSSTTTDRRLGLSGSQAFKTPVKAASTANITLSGEQTIDGVSCVSGDRVLVKNQTTQTDNGIYDVDTGTWTRSLDCNGSYDIRNGTLVEVNQGTVSARLVYVCTASDTITIGTTNITFAAINPGTAISVPVSTAQGGTGGTSGVTGLAGLGVVACTAVGGTANAITCTVDSTVTAYRTNQIFELTPASTNTSSATLTPTPSGAGALSGKNIFLNGVALTGGELPASIPVLLLYDGTQFNIIGLGSSSALVDPAVCDFRLTLTTGLAVTTADVTASTTLYASPYKGNRIALFDGTARWNLRTSAEFSIAVPATTSQMYDVFCFDNAGVATLELLAWTNDTARATALTLQNGVYVKTGATTRRYLGSFRTTGVSGQTEDSIAKRYVWNYYNRAARPMRVSEATDTWTYTTATIRQANGAAANQLDFVIGVSEDAVRAAVIAACSNTNANAAGEVMIGLDSTTAMATGNHSAFQTTPAASIAMGAHAAWEGFPGVGRHVLTWLEISDAVGTMTWYGDNGTQLRLQSGIRGEVRG